MRISHHSSSHSWLIHILAFYGPGVPRDSSCEGVGQIRCSTPLQSAFRYWRTRTVVEGGTKAKHQTLCQVQAMDDSPDSQFMLTCQIVPSVLQQKLPNWNVQTDKIPIPSDISLADPTWYVPQPIDLIISNEFYNDIYTSKILRLGQGFPVLKESCFGWVISGPHTSSSPTDQIAYVGTTLASIDSSLKKFWEVEEVSSDHLKTPDHETVENIFQETTTRDGSGLYIVHIPFRPSVTRLHNNLPNATKQFLLLEKRLSNKPEIKTQYHAAMQENFDLNFFEKVPPEEINSTSYYMPHHAVIKESPVGTKLRIVKNASSKSQTGLSLNDVAMMGPIVQPDIATILLRFREHPYAFCCDIQKMYPQVLLHPPHRDYHRILWRYSPSEPISHYRARGVCFGVTTSSYLATRVLIDLAEKEQVQFPLAAKALKQNFYVDDCLISFPSIPEAKECRLQLTELHASAGMTLAKWCVNDPQITDHSDQRESCDIFPEKSKALGMIWLPQDDQFTFKLTKDFSKANTKREVLAAIAYLYDPLGLISPVIVVGKLILQEIWKAQIPWDQPMSSEIITKWKQFAEGLSSIHSLHVPRSVSEFKSPKSRELHVFCDSSSFAYGAVAYVVTENETGERKAQLSMAESRIAPTESITIPKLELCATVLGARLIKKIQESLSFNEYFPWTDSTIVLGQIRSKRVKFDVFTAHRISEIHKLTDSSKWQHVPGGSNPADIVSRGNAEDWPEDPYGVTFIASNIANESQLPPHPLETILNKSNSYVKVKNILAYVLRFLTKSTRRVKGPLTSTEIHASEHKLISFAQSQHLSEVRSAIADGSMWTGRKFNNVSHLTPFIDEQRIIRVGGRLAKSLQDYEVRHPMLLPKCRL
ncbi:uncharacterized protein LOC129809399 [Phlebotomus papatasi]|uniref:uncharacterized protein LOC129809399 n=1 Tax=Phlebotomus papatasi TaxID=29031 RepID=UPI002483D7C1|nr:uncharacterized protein LOC129809399 [Phlebotomus papatasi]